MSDDLDDDWFERAVGGATAPDDDASDSSGSADDEQDRTDSSTGSTDVEDGLSDLVDGAPAPETGQFTDLDGPSDSAAPRSTDGPSAGEADAGTGDDDSDSLFDEDFGAALENVEMPSIDDEDVPQGFSDVEFGLGVDEPDFDEAVDSALARIDLGIDGLDRMIQGGVPERSLMVAIGSAGTGKTTFGLQFLNHGLEQGERAVFITLEETRERVINSATEKGFRFDEFVEEGQLAVVDIDPVEMANRLDTIQSELPSLVESFEATRLVLDSVSLLEMMYESRSKRRNEIFDFTQSLKSAGVTALLTSEASEETPYASRYGIVEYLTDAVFVMQYVRPDDFRETRLAVEIQKIRDANHSREKKPYEITTGGISVYQQANLF